LRQPSKHYQSLLQPNKYPSLFHLLVNLRWG
jgi:hypothetical protein